MPSEWRREGAGRVAPDDAGRVAPDDAGRVAPDDAERVAPDDAERVAPDDAGRVTPDLAVAARHSEIAEEASDWIWETDTDHCLTFLSKRFGETSGMAWGQANGRPLSDLVEMGFAAAGMTALRAIADARGSFRGAVNRVDLAGGATRFWSLSGRPRMDPTTGVFLGYRGTGTDVTAAIEREAAMKAAVLRAEAAEREALRSRNALVDAIEAIRKALCCMMPTTALCCATNVTVRSTGLPRK